MKRLTNTLEGGYVTPEMEVCSVKAEAGFEASMPSVTIKPWESDDDSLEF
ncbi:MAG: hypothetical protein IKA04_09895 [Alistipes sp.]|nr:hypothetical protein [Alistipes sp.]